MCLRRLDTWRRRIGHDERLYDDLWQVLDVPLAPNEDAGYRSTEWIAELCALVAVPQHRSKMNNRGVTRIYRTRWGLLGAVVVLMMFSIGRLRRRKNKSEGDKLWISGSRAVRDRRNWVTECHQARPLARMR